jgi:hypothetical protein
MPPHTGLRTVEFDIHIKYEIPRAKKPPQIKGLHGDIKGVRATAHTTADDLRAAINKLAAGREHTIFDLKELQEAQDCADLPQMSADDDDGDGNADTMPFRKPFSYTLSDVIGPAISWVRKVCFSLETGYLATHCPPCSWCPISSCTATAGPRP